MTNRELRNTLLALLASEFEPYGFVLNKSQAEFTKKSPDGWQKFHLVFLVRSEGWEINLGMLIRKNVVEDIYHKASYFEPKYHRTTPTIGIPIENFIRDGRDHCFQLSTEADLTPAFQGLAALFKKIALPFFKQYDDIEELDKEVNIETRKSIFSGPKYEGSVGLILAWLANNPRYDQLEMKYRSHYKQIDNGFYLPEYEGVVEVLKAMKASQ